MIRRVCVICIVTLLAAGCALIRPPSTRRTELVFDTPCTVTVFGRNANRAIDAVFEEMRRIDRIMNAYDRSSVVSELNEAAGRAPVSVPEELFRVIETGLAFGEVTDGAFDISIGPLVALWDIGGESPRVPSATEIEDVLDLVNYRDVLLLDYQRQVLLKRAGMRIDLGGIAKGYGADRAAELLHEIGVESALLDFGGNIYAVGSKAQDRPWRIGIQDPFEPRGNYLGVLSIADTSVVTSGTYERYFEANGKRYHHILDPSTGYPVDNGLMSVTIIASSSMTADALATGVFVLGIVDGLALVEAFDGVEAILVDENRRLYLSSGVGERFVPSDDRFTVVDRVKTE